MKRYAILLLGLGCFVASMLSIADSLATSFNEQVCPNCRHVMDETGPFGPADFAIYVVRCDYCGYGFTRTEEDDADQALQERF